MKKIIICLIFILSVTAFSEQKLNSVAKEQGVTGFEVSSFINYNYSKSHNKKQKHFSEKYFIIDSINRNLYTKLNLTDFDKDSNFNLSLNRLVNDSQTTVHNFDLLFDTKIGYAWKLGANISYADVSTKKDDLAQLNLFSKWWNEDDFTVTTTLYSGTYKEHESKKNKKKYVWSKPYWGISNKIEKKYLTFDETTYIPYYLVTYQGMRANQSFNNEIGFSYEKILYQDYMDYDKIITNRLTSGGMYDIFGKEKKYKGLGQDDFTGQIFLREELPLKYNVLEISPFVEFRKSVTTSNFNLLSGLSAKYNF